MNESHESQRRFRRYDMLQKPGSIGKTEAEQRCLTQHINDDFSSCLAGEKRHRCVHAFLFGDSYLCTHPRHRDFT